eukprot:391680-Lingulodinium_polyedra.AAC.1
MAAALANRVWQGGNKLMGAAVVLAFACYLRPCELLSLRCCDIVPPPARGPPRARKWTLILRPAE